MVPDVQVEAKMECEGIESTVGLASQSSQGTQGNQGIAPQERTVCGIEEEMKSLQEALVESRNNMEIEGGMGGSLDQKTRRKLVWMIRLGVSIQHSIV